LPHLLCDELLCTELLCTELWFVSGRSSSPARRIDPAARPGSGQSQIGTRLWPPGRPIPNQAIIRPITRASGIEERRVGHLADAFFLLGVLTFFLFVPGGSMID